MYTCMFVVFLFVAYCASNLYALLNDYIVIKRCPAASAISEVNLRYMYMHMYLGLDYCFTSQICRVYFRISLKRGQIQIQGGATLY